MGKRTQKVIKAEIDALEAEISNKQDYRKNCPKIVELEKEIRQIKEKYFEDNQLTINCWENDLQVLKVELKKKKAEKALFIPEKLEKWFQTYILGIDWGYGGIKIVWISPDERFVILTNTGSTGGQGTVMGANSYYYSNSEHYLIDTLIAEKFRKNNNGKLKEHTGRLTKDIKLEMIKLAETTVGYTFN